MDRKKQAMRYILLGALVLILLNLAMTAAAQPLVVEASLLNVRSGPGTNFQVVDQVPQGTVLKVIQKSNDWAQVVLPSGNRGWVAAWYTKTYNPGRYAMVDVERLNIRSGPGTSNAIIGLATGNMAFPVLRQQNDWCQVLLPDGRHGWIAGWHTTSMTFQSYVTVNASSLNLRGGPGTSHPVLGKLSRGEVLAVIGVSSSGSWLRVALESAATGWVSKSYTNPPGSSGQNKSGPLNGKTIVLDPGHGGPDPGAVGITGYYEKTVNLAVARELAPMLEQAGARVIMTRTGDTNPTLWQRVNLANTSGADVFVSIHSNAHPLASVSGTETYYYAWNASSSRSKILANHLQQQLVGALGLRNIGVKTASFYVITNTTMPSALVELAFLSNYGDEALLRQSQTHRKSAEALYRGLEAFFR